MRDFKKEWNDILTMYFEGDFILALGDIIGQVRRSKSFEHLDLFVVGHPSLKSTAPERYALLASTLMTLSEELSIVPPEWAAENLYLKTPFFPSQLESIRIYLVAESPFYFRRNNIFVSADIMTRV